VYLTFLSSWVEKGPTQFFYPNSTGETSALETHLDLGISFKMYQFREEI